MLFNNYLIIYLFKNQAYYDKYKNYSKSYFDFEKEKDLIHCAQPIFLHFFFRKCFNQHGKFLFSMVSKSTAIYNESYNFTEYTKSMENLTDKPTDTRTFKSFDKQ